jgi:Uma2 family endonuclease
VRRTELYKAVAEWLREKLTPGHCWRCGFRYSDWFVWPPGGRYCFLCWGPDLWESQERPPDWAYAPGEKP